jgi:hypothetical protein
MLTEFDHRLQVKQDSWQGLMPNAVSVACPIKSSRMVNSSRTGKQSATMIVDMKSIAPSYDWTVKILNHFFEEAFIFLHPSGGDKQQQTAMTRVPSVLSLNGPKSANSTPAPNGSSGSAGAGKVLTGYTEADVCECEPVLVSCALRILLRYCVEMEAVDKKGLSQLQVACYVNTVRAIIVYMIPSVETTIQSMLYCRNLGEETTVKVS